MLNLVLLTFQRIKQEQEYLCRKGKKSDGICKLLRTLVYWVRQNLLTFQNADNKATPVAACSTSYYSVCAVFELYLLFLAMLTWKLNRGHM